MRTMLVLALVVSGSVGAEVYKCKNSNGDPMFSDKPCNQEQVEKAVANRTHTNESTASPTETSERTPKKVDFGASPEIQLVRAVAILESIEVDGRDCEWALKVGTGKLAPCLTLLGAMSEGGDFQQATTQLSTLSGTHYDTHSVQINGALRTAQKIIQYKEFAVLRLTK